MFNSSFLALNAMEKKLAEFKCDTNEALSLKLGRFIYFYK